MPYDFGPRDAANFPARCAALAAKHAPSREGGRLTRALDVGCAVGGATFELARSFSYVAGVDFSQAFVNAAKRLQARAVRRAQHALRLTLSLPSRVAQSGERIPCTALEEGTLSSWFVASAPEGVDLGSITFRRAHRSLVDSAYVVCIHSRHTPLLYRHAAKATRARCLPSAPASAPSMPFSPQTCCAGAQHARASHPACTLVTAGMIDADARPFHAIPRLPDPSKFLEALPGLLTPDGVAIIISPYSWLEARGLRVACRAAARWAR